MIYFRKKSGAVRIAQKIKCQSFLASVAQTFLSVRFEAVFKDSRRQVSTALSLCHQERLIHLFLNDSLVLF
jgi:hypothetical protein